MSADDDLFTSAATQLKKSVLTGRSFDSTQVKVIGLDAIRIAAGARWAEIGGRIRANSMHFIQGCLEKDDLVIPAGDGFLVIYSDDQNRNFEALTATLQDSLNTFYLGDEATKSLSAKTTHAKIDSRGLVAMIGAGTSDQIEASKNHKIVFVPVWSVKQEAITAYWVAPRPDGSSYNAYDVSWMDSKTSAVDADYLALDLKIIAKVVEEAERSFSAGRRCLMCYSVHSTTLKNRRRRRLYLDSLFASPEHLRPYLVGYVAEIDPGTPIVTIGDWVTQLRPISPRVTIQLHASDRALTGIDSTGAFAASFTFPLEQHEPHAHDVFMAHAQRWSSALQRQRVKLRMDNVIDRRLIKQALSVGGDFITSERIWPLTLGPKGVVLYSQVHLKQMLEGRS